MNSRRFRVLAATVGLWLSQTLPAGATPPAQPPASEPPRLSIEPGPALQGPAQLSPNQQLADTIATQLRQSGRLHGYHMDICVEAGTVELTGQVADQGQRDEALRIVQGVPGVERVRDRLTLASGTVTAATATTQPVIQEPRPLQSYPAEGPLAPLPGGAPEPMPIFHAPPGPAGAPAATGHVPPPPMPPYAWPTYAPYNNFSRVATPNLYPYQSWPFIGPMYPFPKVPLGWRSVNLRWMDGHWWYGRTATGHDWWRVRYW